jgi:polygalacturonase
MKKRLTLDCSRRDFLGVLGLVPVLASADDRGWDEVPRILARIQAPVFPNRQFDIQKYGAIGDGGTDCTEAFANAIAACNGAGGGRVHVPEGVFFTGPIHLKSNVELHVSEGATLLFARDSKRYLPLVYSRWEGVECMNYSACIYADGRENIAITGGGTLNGNADCEHWWSWKGRAPCGWKQGLPTQEAGRNRLFDMGARDAPLSERLFGEGFYLRPNLIQLCRSKNILIEGVTLKNSPMFVVHPVLCANVTVRGVKIDSHGPNNDGCDPDSCKNMLIENCSFSAGDDCIAIKAGRNRDGRRIAVPSENILVRGCRMQAGHGALTIGSEMSGGVRNVFFENCRLNSPNLNQALRFKTNAMRGGAIERVFFRNISVEQVSGAVLQIDFNYEEGERGPERPVVRDIRAGNINCGKSKYALELRGFASSPIRDVRLEDCAFNGVALPDVVEHVEGLKLSHVKINGSPWPMRTAIEKRSPA